MSERKKVQSALYGASMRIDETRGELQEAVDQLERYEFLQEANPGLLESLRGTDSDLKDIAVRLWETRVES